MTYLPLLGSSELAELGSAVAQASAVIERNHFFAFQPLALYGMSYFPQFQMSISDEIRMLPVRMQVVVLQ